MSKYAYLLPRSPRKALELLLTLNLDYGQYHLSAHPDTCLPLRTPPRSPTETVLLGFSFETPCGSVLAPGDFLLRNSFNLLGLVLSSGHRPQVISAIPKGLQIGGFLRESRPLNHILTLTVLEAFPFPCKYSVWNVGELPSLEQNQT